MVGIRSVESSQEAPNEVRSDACSRAGYLFRGGRKSQLVTRNFSEMLGIDPFRFALSREAAVVRFDDYFARYFSVLW
ncbi:hypothetical protein J3R74_001099 [Puniceicoccus vermicola]